MYILFARANIIMQQLVLVLCLHRVIEIIMIFNQSVCIFS